MDSREPPHSPHPLPHQLQPENTLLFSPNPFTNTTPTTVPTPTAAQFPLSNINTNSSPKSELLSLKPCVGSSSSGSGPLPGVTNSSGFTPHVILVNHGEDIVAKVGAFFQGLPNTDMCILSAHGVVGNVALYQSESIVTYKGKFEIISLSGNLEVSDNTYGCKIMSYFKVCLERPGSHLLVGVVADKLIAESLVKVITGSFTLDCKKASSSNLKFEPSSVPSPQIDASETPKSASDQGTSSDSSGDNGDNASQLIPTMSMYQKLWACQIDASQTPTSAYNQGNSSDSSGDNGDNAIQLIPTMSMYQELWARQTQQ